MVAGGSTITQQLAKNLFLSPARSYVRKAEEAVITVMLEALLTKRRILELYLNVIEWGNGVFGAEAAARRYFGRAPPQLSAEQAARLAAMAPNPRFYERNQGSPYRKIGTSSRGCLGECLVVGGRRGFGWSRAPHPRLPERGERMRRRAPRPHPNA